MRCVAHEPAGAHRELASSPIGSKPLVVCLFTSLLATAVACGGGGSEGGEAPPVRPTVVEVISLHPEPLSIEVALTGQLEAESEVLLKPYDSGVIRSIELVEGRPVSKGAVLYRLDDDEEQARLAEAEAEEKLRRDVFDRTQRLASEDISSIARRAEAVALLDAARARTALRRVELARTRIRAPFDGVVGSNLVGLGEHVKEEDGLVSIAAIDRLQLLFTIPETSIALARIGAPIHARVVAYPGERFPGEVFFISPTVDPASRRLVLKAWIPNADHRLKPGMFANVDVVVAVKDAVLMVPEAAMVYDRNGTYVWRVDEDHKALKVPVEIGFRQAGRVEILRGLNEADRIVSAGTNKVRAGATIEASTAQAAEIRGHARRPTGGRAASATAGGAEG